MNKDKITAAAKKHLGNAKGWSAPKKIVAGVIVVLLGALGLSLGNFDLDLGKLLSGESIEDSRVFTTYGGDECQEAVYNCEDFTTQPEAQRVFNQCGGSRDVHALDGDDDGIACEALPAE